MRNVVNESFGNTADASAQREQVSEELSTVQGANRISVTAINPSLSRFYIFACSVVGEGYVG